MLVGGFIECIWMQHFNTLNL